MVDSTRTGGHARQKVECNNRHKLNHLKNCCLKLKHKVREVSIEDRPEDSLASDYVYSVKTLNYTGSDKPAVFIKLKNVNTKILIDIGTTINILDSKTYANIGSPELRESSTVAYTYQSKNSVKMHLEYSNEEGSTSSHF